MMFSNLTFHPLPTFPNDLDERRLDNTSGLLALLLSERSTNSKPNARPDIIQLLSSQPLGPRDHYALSQRFLNDILQQPLLEIKLELGWVSGCGRERVGFGWGGWGWWNSFRREESGGGQLDAKMDSG